MASWGLTVQKGPWHETARDRSMKWNGANRHDSKSPWNTYNAPSVKAASDVIAKIPFTPLSKLPSYYFEPLVPLAILDQGAQSVTAKQPMMSAPVIPRHGFNPAPMTPPYSPSPTSSIPSLMASSMSVDSYAHLRAEPQVIAMYPHLGDMDDVQIGDLVKSERNYFENVGIVATQIEESTNYRNELHQVSNAIADAVHRISDSVMHSEIQTQTIYEPMDQQIQTDEMAQQSSSGTQTHISQRLPREPVNVHVTHGRQQDTAMNLQHEINQLYARLQEREAEIVQLNTYNQTLVDQHENRFELQAIIRERGAERFDLFRAQMEDLVRLQAQEQEAIRLLRSTEERHAHQLDELARLQQGRLREAFEMGYQQNYNQHQMNYRNLQNYIEAQNQELAELRETINQLRNQAAQTIQRVEQGIQAAIAVSEQKVDTTGRLLEQAEMGVKIEDLEPGPSVVSRRGALNPLVIEKRPASRSPEKIKEAKQKRRESDSSYVPSSAKTTSSEEYVEKPDKKGKGRAKPKPRKKKQSDEDYQPSTTPDSESPGPSRRGRKRVPGNPYKQI
jgi:hypothetical protein